MIAIRTEARRVPEAGHTAGNLLGLEVTADVTTVDGGTIAAAMR